jgi:hypothetical protein
MVFGAWIAWYSLPWHGKDSLPSLFSSAWMDRSLPCTYIVLLGKDGSGSGLDMGWDSVLGCMVGIAYPVREG